MKWIAATLLALLALAYALILFAAPSAEVRPAPSNRGSGGLSLFAAALREAGYRPFVDPSAKPRLRKDDVAVVPVLKVGGQPMIVPAAVVEYAKAGGRAFVIAVPDTLQPVSATFQVRDKRRRKATIDQTASPDLLPPDEQIVSSAVWSGESGVTARLAQVGKGRIAVLEEGALATNRFLGRAENARVVLETFAKVAQRGERVVFLAMGYGEAEDLGPIEAIGPWAVAALWQTLGGLAAYGIARGIRFGLSAPDPRRRRGARELLDALAGQYRRARRTDAPLAVAARDRADDAAIQALAARPKVTEDEARRALGELEARPGKRRETRKPS